MNLQVRFQRFRVLGVLLVGSLDLDFLGFYMNHNKEARSLTFWRASEVSQGLDAYLALTFGGLGFRA